MQHHHLPDRHVTSITTENKADTEGKKNKKKRKKERKHLTGRGMLHVVF